MYSVDVSHSYHFCSVSVACCSNFESFFRMVSNPETSFPHFGSFEVDPVTCVAPRCALTLLCMKPRGHVVSPERKWWVSRYHTTIRFLRNACTSTWIVLVAQPKRAFTEVFSWFQVVITIIFYSLNFIVRTLYVLLLCSLFCLFFILRLSHLIFIFFVPRAIDDHQLNLVDYQNVILQSYKRQLGFKTVLNVFLSPS